MALEEAEILRKRAYAFLRNAERLFEEGEYDLAAFSIEQFCQLLVKYKLLIKTGSYPRSHSLMRLLRELSKAVPERNLTSFINSNVMYLTKIEDAYIGSRYLPRIYEKREVEELLRFAKVFKEVVDSV